LLAERGDIEGLRMQADSEVWGLARVGAVAGIPVAGADAPFAIAFARVPGSGCRLIRNSALAKAPSKDAVNLLSSVTD
jgi:hypothetical protein